MKKYTLVVLTNAIEGTDDAFNRWYTDQHVGDVLAIPGFKAAQRFKFVDTSFAEQPAWRYLALYEFEGDDPSAVLAELMARAGTDALVLDDALDVKSIVAFPVEAITERMFTTRRD
jgi:hypothetical protein